jgi:uncharacterized LabA/DUF88 family protein
VGGVQFAVLMDGAFVRYRLGAREQPAGIEQVRALIATLMQHPQLQGLRLHRIYFYDAKPLDQGEKKPLQGGRVEFAREPIAVRSAALHQALAVEPFMALRIGETQFEGWRVSARTLDKARDNQLVITADDLRPQVTQKGVDMRIGMDIAALTLKRLAQVIVLVTGDSDFVPAMKFARREGAQLFLCPLGAHVKPLMLEHSDLVLDVD